MNHIHICPRCGIFTLKELCSKGHKTSQPAPPRYSPLDKYGGYRRQLKKTALTQKGLL